MEAIRIVITARCNTCYANTDGKRPGWCPDCRGSGRAHHEIELRELRLLLDQETAPIGGGESVAPAALGEQTGQLAGALPLVEPEPIP